MSRFCQHCRSHIGVHYRMDGVYGALMGEAGAIRRLQQVRICELFRIWVAPRG